MKKFVFGLMSSIALVASTAYASVEMNEDCKQVIQKLDSIMLKSADESVNSLNNYAKTLSQEVFHLRMQEYSGCTTLSDAINKTKANLSGSEVVNLAAISRDLFLQYKAIKDTHPECFTTTAR